MKSLCGKSSQELAYQGNIFYTGMDTTCLYNQLLAGYLGGSPVSTDNYGPLLCVTSDVMRTIVVWHRLNEMLT